MTSETTLFADDPHMFFPGPVDVPDDAMAAQLKPLFGHRSDRMDELFGAVQQRLRKVFCTDSRVYLLACSGSGLQEAAIRNCVRMPHTGAKVLILVCGGFSQRWHDVAAGCGRTVVKHELPWFEAFTPDVVAAAVDRANADDNLDAVCLVHNETSTGVMHNLAGISDAIRSVAPNALFLVDAVSSLAGTEIRCDDWHLDICLTSSQKALAVPPGLAVGAVSDRVLERAAEIEGRGWYFDFLNLEAYLARGTTPATPAIPLVQSLLIQLDRILEEGLEARWERHRHLRDLTRRWAVDRGFALCVPDEHASVTVTTLAGPRGWDLPAMNQRLAAAGMAVGSGYGKEKGKSFRIGHLGELRADDLQRLFAVIQSGTA